MGKIIKLVFTINRETLQFLVKDKYIYYTDRKWKNWVQCIPKDPKLIRRVLMSRNQIPVMLVRLFDLSEREQKEYDEAPDDEALSSIIVRDAKLQGCKLVRKEVE